MSRVRHVPRLDRERCRALLTSHSTNELVAKPFRDQLRAALLEIAHIESEHARLRRESEKLARDNQRLLPAADAVLDATRTHSSQCVCPLCRSVRGYREVIRERVAQYRKVDNGSGGEE